MAPSIRMKKEDNDELDEYDKFLLSDKYNNMKDSRNLAPLAEEYHTASQYTVGTEFKLAYRIRSYEYYHYSTREQLIPGFTYPGMKKIILPELKSPSKLTKILNKRRSPKEPVTGSISFKYINQLIYAAHGISDNIFLRTIPSPGATHPTEIYIVVWNIQDLTPGVYHHNIIENTLELLSEKPPQPKDLFSTYNLWEEAAALFIFSIVLPRATSKYGERGYRFSLLETGHSSMNLMIAATELGLQACELGNYYDNSVCETIGADGVEHIIGTTVIVAKKIKKKK